MSTLCGISRTNSSNFLFPERQIPSGGLMLLERQKLSKFTFDLAEKLKVSTRCAYTSILYMQRFLTVQPPALVYPLRVCQGSVFLASKVEENIRPVKDICKYTNELLNTKPGEPSNVVDFYAKAIFDYENLLFATMGLEAFIRHPQDCIREIIEANLDRNRSLLKKYPKIFDSLTTAALYLEKQSILLTAFCVRYSVDLIAWFCIQLAMEIEKEEMKLVNWKNKPFTDQEIQKLINEFSVIYVKRSSVYKKKFAHDQHDLCKILQEKTSYYADLLVKQPVIPALNGEGGIIDPSAHVSNTSQQQPTSSTLLSSTTSSSSHGSYPIPKGEVLSTSKISTASEPVKANTGDKRRSDLTNQLPSEKRQKKEKL